MKLSDFDPTDVYLMSLMSYNYHRDQWGVFCKNKTIHWCKDIPEAFRYAKKQLRKDTIIMIIKKYCLYMTIFLAGCMICMICVWIKAWIRG